MGTGAYIGIILAYIFWDLRSDGQGSSQTDLRLATDREQRGGRVVSASGSSKLVKVSDQVTWSPVFTAAHQTHPSL